MAVAKWGGTDSTPLGSQGRGREGACALGCRWETAGLTGLPLPPSPLRPQSQCAVAVTPAQLHRTPHIPTLDAQTSAFPGNPVYIFVG